MATPFVDDDADLSLVQDRYVAVLGYDDVARAQALCLRDSGVDLRVGVLSDSAVAADAEADGLRVVSAYEACEEADLVVLLTGEPAAGALLTEVVAPNLVAGDVVVIGPDVARASAGAAALLSTVDVLRVVAWSDGATLREEFSQGRGVPMFVTVVQDASGAAWDVALSYARAVGATRAGVLRVPDEQYVAADAGRRLFHDEVLQLVRGAFDRLVADGCAPELAYVATFRGLADFSAQLAVGAHDAALGGSAAYAPAAATVRSLTDRPGSDGRGLH